jgi:hypothetical protein
VRSFSPRVCVTGRCPGEMKESTVLTDNSTRAALKLYNDPCPVSEANVLGVKTEVGRRTQV